VERGRSPGSRCSPSLYVGPIDPVGDDRGVAVPLPGMTCDVHLGRRVAHAPACLVGDVRLDKMGGVSPRPILRLDPRRGR
jgi:hypothetical protein